MPSGWRIDRPRRNAFSGEGARRFGGRWNSPGVAVVYLSEHQSLAALEIFVHLQPLLPHDKYLAYFVEWDEGQMEQLSAKSYRPTGVPRHPARRRCNLGIDGWPKHVSQSSLSRVRSDRRREIFFSTLPTRNSAKCACTSQSSSPSITGSPVVKQERCRFGF